MYYFYFDFKTEAEGACDGGANISNLTKLSVSLVLLVQLLTTYNSPNWGR